MDIDYPVVSELEKRAPSGWTAESNYEESAVLKGDNGQVRIQEWNGTFAVIPAVVDETFGGHGTAYTSVTSENAEVNEIEEAIEVAVELAQKLQNNELESDFF